MSARKSNINEFELAQLSANNRREISRVALEIYKKRYNRLKLELQKLREVQNTLRQQKTALALEHTGMLAEQDIILPFPPFQARVDIRDNSLQSATKNLSSRNPNRKSGEL